MRKDPEARGKKQKHCEYRATPYPRARSLALPLRFQVLRRGFRRRLASLVAACYTKFTSCLKADTVVADDSAKVDVGRRDLGGYGLKYGTAIYAGQAIGLSDHTLSAQKAVSVVEASGLIPRAGRYAGDNLVGVQKRVFLDHIAPVYRGSNTSTHFSRRTTSAPTPNLS